MKYGGPTACGGNEVFYNPKYANNIRIKCSK